MVSSSPRAQGQRTGSTAFLFSRFLLSSFLLSKFLLSKFPLPTFLLPTGFHAATTSWQNCRHHLNPYRYREKSTKEPQESLWMSGPVSATICWYFGYDQTSAPFVTWLLRRASLKSMGQGAERTASSARHVHICIREILFDRRYWRNMGQGE